MFRIVIAIFTLCLMAAHVQAQDVKRAITKIKGDVYRFQNNFHFAIFVITSDGVVVTDPINSEAANWLKGEIAKLTDKPVTHLIYSHSHADHASGGSVFAGTAEVIAEKNAPDQIDGVKPTTRISEPTTISAGNKSIELVPLGSGHGADLMAMVVRPENVVFAVDAVSVNRLPFRDFPGADIDGVIQQIKTVEALDYDILAPGHGAMGGKADAASHRLYVEKLKTAVTEGLNAGASVDDLVASLTLDEYKDWGSYDNWREPNIRGMARWLKETGKVN